MSTATRAIHGTDYLRRTRPAARSLSRARALADLRRPYPAEHRKLADDPELRFLGRRRDFRVHLRLHRGVRLCRAMRERGFVVASARILKRVWTVYVAHVFIFVIFMAQIAYVTTSQDNPLYSEEMRAFDFLQQPGVALLEALILKFQPNFMDV